MIFFLKFLSCHVVKRRAAHGFAAGRTLCMHGQGYRNNNGCRFFIGPMHARRILYSRVNYRCDYNLRN